MSDNCWSVYRHVFPNGKVYIGKTARIPDERWGENGIGYRKQNKIFNAILAYGWVNIKHEVLYEGLSEKEAGLIEQRLIEALSDNDCYNIQFVKRDKYEKQKHVDVQGTKLTYLFGERDGLQDGFYGKCREKLGGEPVCIKVYDDRAEIDLLSADEDASVCRRYSARRPAGMSYRQVISWLNGFDCQWVLIEEQIIVGSGNVLTVSKL